MPSVLLINSSTFIRYLLWCAGPCWTSGWVSSLLLSRADIVNPHYLWILFLLILLLIIVPVFVVLSGAEAVDPCTGSLLWAHKGILSLLDSSLGLQAQALYLTCLVLLCFLHFYAFCGWFKKTPKPTAKVLSSVSKCKKAGVCLKEKHRC